jgi:hypothetical protein
MSDFDHLNALKVREIQALKTTKTPWVRDLKKAGIW